jgi:hypothetical protein
VWEAANRKRAEKERPPLVPIELHSCRHTFVSLMHDAGLSLERITEMRKTPAGYASGGS